MKTLFKKLLTVIVALIFTSNLMAKTIYVSASSTRTNTGASWTNAYTSFQSALDAAVSGDQIWVAKGTYKPSWDYGWNLATPLVASRGKHFRMKNGVAIYGGFASNETSETQRLDYAIGGMNETVLSGDLSGNDDFMESFSFPWGGNVSEMGYRGGTGDDNCYHVFYHPSSLNLDASAVLDGFTIKGGNASYIGTYSDAGIQYFGGGMFNDVASPTIRNCTFTKNAAFAIQAGSGARDGLGGAMYNTNSSSPTITNCSFTINSAYDAAIYNYSSAPVISACTITGNYSIAIGGIHNFGNWGLLTISNSVISNNYSHAYGGGIANENCDNVIIQGCTLNSNYTCQGGAICNISANAIISNCTFTKNVADNVAGYGGAIFNVDPATTVLIQNCVFDSNRASEQGGAIADYQSESTVINSTFSGNTAHSGGAISCFVSGADEPNSKTTLENCILWGNSATSIGNEIYCSGSNGTNYCQVTLNYTSYDNRTNDVIAENGGTITATNQNITTNPKFVNASSGDLRLYGNSPAVNAGNNSYNTLSMDISGKARIQNTTIDMGAYEWTSGIDPTIIGNIYVKFDASGLNNGTSWANAFTSFQSALNLATTGDQIWVAKGTYKPSSAYDLTNTSRYYHFRLKEGVAIYGGFLGTETSTSQRTTFSADETNETILSGDIGIIGDNSDNCYHVLYHPNGLNLTSATVIDGFTVSGGNANGAANPHSRAGGMYIYSSSPTISNVVFKSNSSTDIGGGMYLYNSTSHFTNVSFLNNVSASSGGGVYVYNGSPLFEKMNCTSNSANNGGAMYIYTATPTINNAQFIGNTSTTDGGALSTHSSSPIITNSLFASNTTTVNGGGIIFYSTSVAYTATLNNVTLSSNTAGISGGGIRFASANVSSALNLNNCIVCGNTATTSGNELSLNSVGSTTINYSCFKNATNDVVNSGGTLAAINNNITANPLFVNTTGNDFRLYGNSPCINTGNNSYNALSTDIRGQARIQNSTIDMGAYEWTSGTDPANNLATGTENNAIQSGMLVYPNPSNGIVNFRFTPENGDKTTIDILSITGELVYRVFEGTVEQGTEQTIQFTKPLAEGLYIYKLTNGNQIKTSRLIRMVGNN